MTVIAGYAFGHDSSGALELATAVAAARGEDLVVVTVVQPRWNVPSMARVDGEFAAWVAEHGQDVLNEAEAGLKAIGSAVPVSFRQVSHRSAAAGLLEVAEAEDASVIVVGSSDDGRRGFVELGSTSDRLVHSAQLPVAIAPRGYNGPGEGFGRVSCAVAGHDEDPDLIEAAVELAESADVPLRLVTFAVRLKTMYPPEVGLRAEDEVALAARDQAQAVFTELRDSGGIAADVETVVGLGHGWRAAIDSIPWEPDEVLVIGSRPQGVLARVFLGTSATKIVRHVRVPVVVLPA